MGCIIARVVGERLLILEGDKEQEPTAELNNEEPVSSAGDRCGGHSLQREVSDCLHWKLHPFLIASYGKQWHLKANKVIQRANRNKSNPEHKFELVLITALLTLIKTSN